MTIMRAPTPDALLKLAHALNSGTVANIGDRDRHWLAHACLVAAAIEEGHPAQRLATETWRADSNSRTCHSYARALRRIYEGANDAAQIAYHALAEVDDDCAARPDRAAAAVQFAKIIHGGNGGDTDVIFWQHLDDETKRRAFEIYDAAAAMEWP